MNRQRRITVYDESSGPGEEGKATRNITKVNANVAVAFLSGRLVMKENAETTTVIARQSSGGCRPKSADRGGWMT